MRTLKFIVEGQQIFKDPECNFEEIVSGSANFLKAVFQFSSDWNGMVKVAEFRNYKEETCVPVKIVNSQCVVPFEVTKGNKWYVKVVGKRGTTILPTKQCVVRQEV